MSFLSGIEQDGGLFALGERRKDEPQDEVHEKRKRQRRAAPHRDGHDGGKAAREVQPLDGELAGLFEHLRRRLEPVQHLRREYARQNAADDPRDRRVHQA